MIISQLFTHANYAFRGNDDEAPASGTTDWTMWLSVTNRLIAEFTGDDKNTWQSMFDIREAGTVAAGTQTYDLDSQIRVPADKVIVTTTVANGSHDIQYRIVKPQERDRYPRSVYISGSDPQKLTFSDTITSTSAIVGGTIKVAAYYIEDDLTTANDTILVDDPYWLVYALAAQLAFNDLTYESKYPDLLGKANDLYAGMVSANRRGSNNNPRVVRTNVQRITGPTRNIIGSA